LTGVHLEQPVVEVEDAIGFVGEELGSDFELRKVSRALRGAGRVGCWRCRLCAGWRVARRGGFVRRRTCDPTSGVLRVWCWSLYVNHV